MNKIHYFMPGMATGPSLKETFKCLVCNRSFLYQHSLDTHVKKHQAAFACQQCDKTFVTQTLLEVHELQNHKAAIQCQQINKSFLTKTSLEVHKFTSHKLCCKICGKVYVKDYYLREHMKKHEETGLECNVCNKTFASRSVLEEHQVLHTRVAGMLKGLKELQCDVCNKTFASRSVLEEHQVLHTRVAGMLKGLKELFPDPVAAQINISKKDKKVIQISFMNEPKPKKKVVIKTAEEAEKVKEPKARVDKTDAMPPSEEVKEPKAKVDKTDAMPTSDEVKEPKARVDQTVTKSPYEEGIFPDMPTKEKTPQPSSFEPTEILGF